VRIGLKACGYHRLLSQAFSVIWHFLCKCTNFSSRLLNISHCFYNYWKQEISIDLVKLSKRSLKIGDVTSVAACVSNELSFGWSPPKPKKS
jgi:hypothetical protein